MTPFELEILNALRMAGNDVSVAEIISRAKITRARANVSSRLCELRAKDLCSSTQHDGVNYWSLTAKGREVLGLESQETPDSTPDISDPETPPEPVAEQPVEVGISVDISEDDIPRFAYESEPDDTDDISPALIEESRRVRPAMHPINNLSDALFVLDTLALTYCVDMPAYQQELGRIARYLREAA